MSGEATIRQLDRDTRPKRVIDIRSRDSFARAEDPEQAAERRQKAERSIIKKFRKQLIRRIAAQDPVVEKNIFRSVENVNLNTVIAYKKDGVKHHFLDAYDGAEHKTTEA